MTSNVLADVRRILIYKRTHNGDPDETGVFGCCNCMGQVRGWCFDAVIGIGGTGVGPKRNGIDRRINWIGIGATKHDTGDVPSPTVSFEHFLAYRECGQSPQDPKDMFPNAQHAPHVADISPLLARIFYRPKHPPRFRMLTRGEDAEFDEALKVLRLAGRSPTSSRQSSRSRTRSSCARKPRGNAKVAGPGNGRCD